MKAVCSCLRSEQNKITRFVQWSTPYNKPSKASMTQSLWIWRSWSISHELFYVYTILDSFSCQHKKLSGTVWTRQHLRTGTRRSHTSHNVSEYLLPSQCQSLGSSLKIGAGQLRSVREIDRNHLLIMCDENSFRGQRETYPVQCEHSLIHLIDNILHKDLAVF